VSEILNHVTVRGSWRWRYGSCFGSPGAVSPVFRLGAVWKRCGFVYVRLLPPQEFDQYPNLPVILWNRTKVKIRPRETELDWRCRCGVFGLASKATVRAGMAMEVLLLLPPHLRLEAPEKHYSFSSVKIPPPVFGEDLPGHACNKISSSSCPCSVPLHLVRRPVASNGTPLWRRKVIENPWHRGSQHFELVKDT
jgi:hypothetical protein